MVPDGKQYNIYAIIVTYNGSMENIEQLINILRQDNVCHIIIDNGSESLTFSNNLHVLQQNSNLGIAEAQNIGVEYCIKNEADIIVFFDQDSEIESGFVKNLVEPIIAGHTEISAPTYVDICAGFAYPIIKVSPIGIVRKHYFKGNNEERFTTNAVISSGMAVKMDLFKKVGLFNKLLFIDYVDTEWCLRCFSQGYTASVNPKLKMRHAIGNYSLNVGFFRVPVHSPMRRYYRIRNAFLLMRMKHIPILLILKEISFFYIHQIIILFGVRKNIGEYLYYTFLGTYHGITNRSGILRVKK